MAQITLDLADTTEPAETLTFIADCLSGSQQPAQVCLPPRRQRRRRALRRANAMTTNTGAARPLDRITRITPKIRSLALRRS
jgi:hypothetical protein